ncbi:MAG: hypothetical protein RLZZ618_4087 [Pseudomonadota bacterium]|jgi:hypothetical protein
MKTRRREPRTLEERASLRVSRKLRFYIHVLVFVVVNGLFFAKQLVTGAHWPGFGFWGWGLALTVHGLITFVRLQGEGLRERMIRQEIERMRKEE